MRNYFIMIDIDYLKGFDQIIFDLDDTLIYEIDYLFAGYLEIAKNFGKSSLEKTRMFTYLVDNFKLGNRSKLFNDFIYSFSLNESDIVKMLTILRNVKIKGSLRLTNEAKIILYLLMVLNKKYYVVTNGNPIQQSNKLKQINWDGLPMPTKVVFANEYKPKPSPDSFFQIRELLSQSKILYIGDSEVDFEYAKNCGMNFYKLKIV